MRRTNWTNENTKRALALVLALIVTLLAPLSLAAKDKKKKKDEAASKPAPVLDYSNIVWPNPPAIARIRYMNWFAAQRIDQVEGQKKAQKQKWMDRLAGTQPASENPKVLYQLGEPYGIAVDSKGNVYVADQKVGAIFIFDTETKAADLMKNKVHGHFARIIGLAMDDNDRLFVSDPGLRHILVFNKEHVAEGVITEGISEPGCMTIDRQNRLLYVSDVALDQVVVFDADSLKVLRKIGKTGHNHELTTPGDFAKPSGLAVDKEGNLYVADTLNNRIEIFDADGNFISTFGKAGDGPGHFARPKGVAIDSDGHIWVVDGMLDKVQVFSHDGQQLMISFGGRGLLPGQFQGLVSITIDDKDRVFTSEIFPGRVQGFRYVTDAAAEAEKKRREQAGTTKAAVSAPQPAAGDKTNVAK